jgi:hypothetical protein
MIRAVGRHYTGTPERRIARAVATSTKLVYRSIELIPNFRRSQPQVTDTIIRKGTVSYGAR